MDWQTSVALLIVTIAIWRIVLQSREFFSKSRQTACGGCHACPSSPEKTSSGEFVALETGLDEAV